MSFFCDNCGKPVSIHDDNCANCGAEFKGIRCPSCQYSGPATRFLNGCPKCGYLKKDLQGIREVDSVIPEKKDFAINPSKLFYRISIAVLSVILLLILFILFKP